MDLIFYYQFSLFKIPPLIRSTFLNHLHFASTLPSLYKCIVGPLNK
jgi:hypothetical protein